MAKTQDEADLQNPEEAFSWMFAAGVPDPRGEKFRNQPLVPPACWPALSKMIWDMGGRVDPSKQVKWVNPASGPFMNFQAWGTCDKKPDPVQRESEAQQIANALTQAAPETAEKMAQVRTPEEVKALGEQLQKRIVAGMEQINQLTKNMQPEG